LRKPFEASVVIDIVRPLILAAQADREAMTVARAGPTAASSLGRQEEPPVAPQPELPVAASPPADAAPEVDPERVRAAVTVALDAAFPSLIEEITEKVLHSLRK
jgi:hypothetical protein